MAMGLFLVKAQILEQRRLRSVVRMIEEEGFTILDMCLLEIGVSDFEEFMHGMDQKFEAIELALYSQGKAALFAVSHKADLILTRGSRIELAAKVRFFPREDAVETWFGKLVK